LKNIPKDKVSTIKSKNPIKSTTQLSFENLLDESDDMGTAKMKEIEIGSENIDLRWSVNTFPSNLARDFDQFIGYIQNHTVLLTKTKEYISRKHLPAIDTLMSVKAKDATSYTTQEYCPLIHLFYYLALNGRLIEKVSAKAGQFQLQATKRINLYKELSDTEKYLAKEYVFCQIN
jgi:hypothetical protein